jgi:reverse gyrase
MGYHEDCPECGNQLPDEVSASDGPCTTCLKQRIAELEEALEVIGLLHEGDEYDYGWVFSQLLGAKRIARAALKGGE